MGGPLCSALDFQSGCQAKPIVDGGGFFCFLFFEFFWFFVCLFGGGAWQFSFFTFSCFFLSSRSPPPASFLSPVNHSACSCTMSQAVHAPCWATSHGLSPCMDGESDHLGPGSLAEGPLLPIPHLFTTCEYGKHCRATNIFLISS